MNCKKCNKILRKTNTRGICYKCWPSTTECKEYMRTYVQSHPEQHTASNDKYRENNKDKIKESSALYYVKNADRTLARQKAYYEDNKEARLQYQKDNRSKINARNKILLDTDMNARLAARVRNRIYDALKAFLVDKDPERSAVKDLGCSLEELRVFIESKFFPNPRTGEIMTWKNWTKKGWHLDHIIPLMHFDLKELEQFKNACHFMNLQPLWAKENLSKNGQKRDRNKSHE